MNEPISTTVDPVAVSHEIDALNSLLRGEVAAVEAYDMVLPKFDGRSQAVALQRLRDEHTEAAAVLRERIRHFGGDPAEGSGVWGKVAAAVTGTAKLLGASSALGTLKQGEEYGIGQYENSLSDPELDVDDKDLIRYRLLPRCLAHVRELDHLIEAA
jgi:hypothetical protein